MQLIQGECLDKLGEIRDSVIQCCVTSPPYWGLRDYGVEGQLGLEKTPEEYVEKVVRIFREVRRVLRDDGTLWLNLGDTYNAQSPPGERDVERWPKQSRNDHTPKMRKATKTLKPKDLCGVPWRVAFALQDDGWYLRSDIIWSKPNPMPESVQDRPTKAHEYLFLMAKSQKYYYDAEAIREPNSDPQRSNYICGSGKRDDSRNDPDMCERSKFMEADGRNKRSVWEIPTQSYPEAHFATFPEQLPKLCILAGTKPGDTVLDPFAGSFTVGKVASELGRDFIGIELNPEYVKMGKKRISQIGMEI